MADLPSGSIAINAQFFKAPDGSVWQYQNDVDKFRRVPITQDLDEINISLDERNNMRVTERYSNSYYTDILDFTSTGFIPTIQDGSSIRMSGGTNDFTKFLILKGLTSSDEKDMIEIIVKVGAINSTNYGIGIGRKSINTWAPGGASQARSVLAQVSFLNANGRLSFNDLGALENKGSKNSSLNLQSGDLVRIRFIQYGFSFWVTAENLTRNRFDSYKVSGALNTSDIVIYNFGGINDITSVRVATATPINCNVVVIGDSKSKGDRENQRYSRFIGSLGTVRVFAGNSDRTVEAIQGINQIVAIKPKYALICIGRNDVASGVSNATWQGNYTSMVNTLSANNIIVKHILTIPETSLSGANQTLLRNFVISNWPNDYIDPAIGWDMDTMLSADGVHENDKGDRHIALSVLTSGKLPLPINKPLDEEQGAFQINPDLSDYQSKTDANLAYINNNPSSTQAGASFAIRGSTSLIQSQSDNFPPLALRLNSAASASDLLWLQTYLANNISRIGSDGRYYGLGLGNFNNALNCILSMTDNFVLIRRDISDNNPVAVFDNIKGTQNTLQVQLAGVTVGALHRDGGARVPYIANLTARNQGGINFDATGIQMQRDLGDANSVVKIENLNAASTGQVLELKDLGVVIASIDRLGGIKSKFIAPLSMVRTDADNRLVAATVGTDYSPANVLNVGFTTPQTNATLNTSYPSVIIGQQVTAPNIGTGMKYEKVNNVAGGEWKSWPLNPTSGASNIVNDISTVAPTKSYLNTTYPANAATGIGLIGYEVIFNAVTTGVSIAKKLDNSPTGNWALIPYTLAT